MSDVLEKIAPKKLPLDETHERLGAAMKQRDGWLLPATYNDTRSEYAAVREGGAGLFDLSARGRLIVGGSEAVQFLNGLITNDMKTLDHNTWMPAAFPNVQGRLIASVRVVGLEETQEVRRDSIFSSGVAAKNGSPTFMIDTESATHERVWKTLERFTFAGDFKVSDITGKTAHLSLQGDKSADVVNKVLAFDATHLSANGSQQIDWKQAEVLLIRSGVFSENGFDLIVNKDLAAELWHEVIEAGAQPAGDDAFEILRIESGIPRYGVDMDETNVVTETNLDDAVSYTKGCYVGQEIVARIKYRGHVAKKLSGMVFEGAPRVEPGSPISSIDGKEIGRLTSVTNSPKLGCTIALGYLKFDYLERDTAVKVFANGLEYSARVVDLPFVAAGPKKSDG